MIRVRPCCTNVEEVLEHGPVSPHRVGSVDSSVFRGRLFSGPAGARWQARCLVSPHASVAVLVYRPFYILGEVSSPGAYSYVSGMKVLSAVAAAHGYTYRANQDYVIITRNGEEAKADIMLSIRPDDIIRVPERYF